MGRTEKSGGETKIFKRGGQTGSMGGCPKKRGAGTLLRTMTNDEHKSIQVQLKLHLRKYTATTHETLNKKYMKCTKRSKYIWNLTNQGITPIVKLRTVKKVNSKVSPSYCKLCLTKKFFIIKSLDDCNLLNTRFELVSKLRHQSEL